VYVRDINLCVRTISITIENLDAPAFTLSASPASCGLSDGTITATATGGTLPLQYSKNGTVYQASNIFTGLAAGTYTIYVRDARNCITQQNVTVSTVGSTVTPTFNPIGPLCQQAVPPALPLTSNNSITGTWSPATISTATAGTFNYAFTPSAGACAVPVVVAITINPKPTAIIISHN
jgi:hypothetical protein